MAVSIEARTPFLDYRMMELAFRMPGGDEAGPRGNQIHLQEGRSPVDRRRIDRSEKDDVHRAGGGMVPRSIGPLPGGRVARAPDRGERGLFRPETVRTLIEDHRAGRANRTRELRALIAVELWARIFLDGDGARCPSLDDLDVDSGLVRGGAG
jgi:asparagine synthase (glutamine-hydrolysing)